MGIYTHFAINVNLVKDTPKDVIETLEWLFWKTEKCPIEEGHKLFGIEEMRAVTQCQSAYFDGDSYCQMERDDWKWKLTINSNLKNYYHQCEKFLDYIHPFIEQWVNKKFLGFMRCEEFEDPILIYNTRNGIEYKEVQT